MQYHPSLSISPLHAEGVWVNLFYSKIFFSFRKSTYSRLGFTQPQLLFLDSENLNLLHLKTAIRTRWVHVFNTVIAYMSACYPISMLPVRDLLLHSPKHCLPKSTFQVPCLSLKCSCYCVLILKMAWQNC